MRCFKDPNDVGAAINGEEKSDIKDPQNIDNEEKGLNINKLNNIDNMNGINPQEIDLELKGRETKYRVESTVPINSTANAIIEDEKKSFREIFILNMKRFHPVVTLFYQSILVPFGVKYMMFAYKLCGYFLWSAFWSSDIYLDMRIENDDRVS